MAAAEVDRVERERTYDRVVTMILDGMPPGERRDLLDDWRTNEERFRAPWQIHEHAQRESQQGALFSDLSMVDPTYIEWPVARTSLEVID